MSGWIKNELSKEDITADIDLKERVKNLWEPISEKYISNLRNLMKGRILECNKK